MSFAERGESLDYDFEDLLDSFERNFAKKLAERTRPIDNTEGAQCELKAQSSSEVNYGILDFEAEFSCLLRELTQTVIGSRQAPCYQEDDGLKKDEGMDESIIREVIRTEIKDLMSKARQYEEMASDSPTTKSSQKASIASLKRRARELTSECEELRRQKKESAIRERSLNDKQETHLSKIKMLQDQAGLLRTEREEQDSKLREFENSIENLAADKKRLEKNVAMLRTELLSSHHKVSEQKLKTTQAERRIADLEARAAELRVSESALSDRVKELHDVQAQMLDEMKKVVESKDVPAARRALTNLSQQRSRIVGKIAAIMTKRNHGLSNTGDNTERDIGTPHANEEREGRISITRNSQIAGNEVPAVSSGPPSVDENAFQRKSSILGKFRIGGGNVNNLPGQPATTDRPSPLTRGSRQQIYENNLERSRDAAEKDSGVLREMVEYKSSEIERLAEELRAAKDDAEELERELHAERQNRHKENKNTHVVADQEARKSKLEAAQRRSKPQTLFDWQSASGPPTDGGPNSLNSPDGANE